MPILMVLRQYFLFCKCFSFPCGKQNKLTACFSDTKRYEVNKLKEENYFIPHLLQAVEELHGATVD